MSHTIDEEVAMMQNPMKWPHLVLPVIRKDWEARDVARYGILIGNGPIVYFTNMFSFHGDVSGLERREYKSFQELAQEWRID
jgi:hypothetical protein